MRRRALQPEVLPGVQAAGRVRRHDGERVQDDGEVMLLRRRPDRLETGMVERHAVRRVGHHCPGPARLSPALYLFQPGLHVARADQDQATQAIGICAAVVLHPAVVGAIHRHLELHVVTRGPGAEPARRKREVDVDAFVIEILDALGWIVVALRRRLALAPRAGESRHVPALVGRGRGGAELAQVAALSLRVDAVSLARRLEGLPAGELRLLFAREVALEHIHVGSDMRVGIEDAESVSRHAAF